MMSISHSYKTFLSKDIEININSKIENIKNTNKWSDLNVKSAFDKMDFSTLEINDIKNHAALLENISKLSVDLLLDYDYYKKFIFKGEFRSVDYDEKLRMLGYEIEDDYWHHVNKPSKDTVIMNVFLSCLYNGLVEIMQTIEQCPYCDTLIEPNSEKCSICGEPVENMLISVISSKRKLPNNNINDGIKRSEIDRLHLPNEINIIGENKNLDTVNTSKLEPIETQSGKDETTCKNTIIVHDVLNKNKNRWICKACECLNPFDLINCQACGAPCKENGFWICCHCGLVNEMLTDICSACNTNNDLIIQVNDKWKCWKPVCNGLNDDKFKFCHKCGLQRTPPVTFSDLIERNVEDKIIKLWICEKCWQYNSDNSKFCVKKQCNEPRYKQTSKIIDETNMKTCDIDPNVWICKKCTIPNPKESDKCSCCGSLNVVETEWKCWNKNCERVNKIKDNYCQTCKLDKNPPDHHTKLVKSYAGNEMREIWICGKCEKYNPKDRAKCNGKNCGAFIFFKGDDSKDDENKAANQNEIKTNSCQWKCDECTFINNGSGQHCTLCNSDRNGDTCGETSNSWKCWFVNCRQSNDNQYEFCQHCKLDRFANRNRGAPLNCEGKDGVKKVWICQKCFKYNSLSNEVCSGKNCDNPRF